MTSLPEYVQRVRSKHPVNFSTLDPFPKTGSVNAPTLLKDQVNRVIIYRGCFSPPHVGHLTLLKHAFEHGGRDLNIIAAIIKPVGGCSRPATAKCSGKTIAFSLDERLALWNKDKRLPEWAWVYEGPMTQLKNMLFCLVEMANGDGHRLEFVALYGPDYFGLIEKPYRHHWGEVSLVGGCGVKKDVVFEGCEITMICDAAREAVGFDTAPTRTLKRFQACGDWRRPVLDVRALEREGKGKAEHVVGLLREKDLDRYERLLSETGSEAAAIGEMAKRSVTEAVKDNQHILVCHVKDDKGLQIRFVRRDRSEPGFEEEGVSATILRNVIETEEGEQLWEKVGRMALSPEVLREMMEVEIGAEDKAEGGKIMDLGRFETRTALAFREEEPNGF